MLIRLLALTALILPITWSAETVAAPRLSEEAIITKLQEIQRSLQAVQAQQDESGMFPEMRLLMADLDSVIDRAENPVGDAVLSAHLLRARLFMMTGQNDKCEADLKSITNVGGSPKVSSAAYYMLAMLYQQSGNKDAEIIALAESAEKAKVDPEVLGALQGMARQAALVPGSPTPDISFIDLGGEKHKLSDFRGKILLVDFWATWCITCLRELPNVKATYAEFHDRGFEIVGISLDQERPKLDRFLKDKAIPWMQSCDEKGWQNEAATQVGIHKLPTTFLIDAEGKLIAKDLLGDDLKAAVEKAVEALPTHAK